LEPSPGNGPAVSSGTSVRSPLPDVVPVEPELEDGAEVVPPEAAPVDQRAQVVDEPAVGLVDLVAVLVEPAPGVGRGPAASGGHVRSICRSGRDPVHGVDRTLPSP
jgi:hypothetical protein